MVERQRRMRFILGTAFRHILLLIEKGYKSLLEFSCVFGAFYNKKVRHSPLRSTLKILAYFDFVSDFPKIAVVVVAWGTISFTFDRWNAQVQDPQSLQTCRVAKQFRTN